MKTLYKFFRDFNLSFKPDISNFSYRFLYVFKNGSETKDLIFLGQSKVSEGCPVPKKVVLTGKADLPICTRLYYTLSENASVRPSSK